MTYTAVVLNSKSIKDILENFYVEIQSVGLGFQMQNSKGDPLLHHVTVNMGSFDKKLNNFELFNKEITMNIVTFAKDSKVAAFGIEFKEIDGFSVFGNPSVKTKNKIPHITACISKTGKPFDSNNLKEWNLLYKSLLIRGILT